jgi:hypothetical protein
VAIPVGVPQLAVDRLLVGVAVTVVVLLVADLGRAGVGVRLAVVTVCSGRGDDVAGRGLAGLDAVCKVGEAVAVSVSLEGRLGAVFDLLLVVTGDESQEESGQQGGAPGCSVSGVPQTEATSVPMIQPSFLA